MTLLFPVWVNGEIEVGSKEVRTCSWLGKGESLLSYRGIFVSYVYILPLLFILFSLFFDLQTVFVCLCVHACACVLLQ